ncbi:MAG: bifunctional phosphoserine phosphatase/homoserine phosphotransferase ThrH [Deltaproteobacteria bacterium]|jgi:phosphoserine / homoserine phosphotransferase|nr:bifunctional phosphoserine phosphatase/homoserine phosphotransferase ThrH [Deltaproteobacteria bacterium]MBT4263888.1 bifunctional phosphoserine phosphatase/homoserine phosphotransferase ThrH [Deltaproteobacteria bacterium]MBT6503641.1 bifunctional phosphoserine phosphatase/homoserine phosphotransferase ThrH [Deltaproteobacteria bacterium]MBT7153543.1 bifunctional phosphoserine phosphatase/homoserine phosphotransferase ThrH [Deltaproteobacteria bacterium]MBT7711166.1 bifunctional phosphoseri
MLIACLDLEGVLFPEVWINVAEKTGITELKLTTRDIADYDELMGIRLKIIAEKKLTLKDIQDTIASMDPLPGALNFLDWLREECQVIILSDTFDAFARPIMRKLKMPAIFCHELGVDESNIITSYRLRMNDAKTKAIDAFRSLNFKTLAVGDSFNDLGMLQKADHGIFFQPPAEISAQYKQIPVAQDYEALKAMILDINRI